MDEAIAVLKDLKAEYERASEEMYQSTRYYDDLKAKISATDEALVRLMEEQAFHE